MRQISRSKDLLLVSCLCVTEDRKDFLPWLYWNYAKQDYENRELVIVDSSADPLMSTEQANVKLIRAEHGSNIARKRNLALEAAAGALVTWFDDDDWQHPRKLSILAETIGSEGVLAGPTRSWFVDLDRERARAFDLHSGILFNGLGVRRTKIEGIRFDECRERATDTVWVSEIRRHTRCSPAVVAEVLSFWLCHRRNISNPAARYVFDRPLEDVKAAVGDPDWGQTTEQLALLRSRIAAST